MTFFLLFRNFFIEKLHNLLCFCVHFAKNFANHTLSEMILLREVLGRITFAFDVGSRVQEYMRASLPPPSPPKKITIFDSNHACIIPQGILNYNCVYLRYIHRNKI